MQRLRGTKGTMIATAIGVILLGGISYATAAEEPKKTPEQAVPPATGKAPAAKKESAEKKASEKKAPEQKASEKKAPEKKAAAKGGGQKAKPAAAPASTAPAPKYASAETAAKAQACFGEEPKIESMTPDEGKAGDTITISGRNFGPAECLRSLSFGPGYPATFKLDNPSQITATVPSGRRKGLAMMTVTTASGEDSKVFVVK
jgi:hypothetical protein